MSYESVDVWCAHERATGRGEYCVWCDVASLRLELSAAYAERSRLIAEITALKALMKLPEDYCLSCGGNGGHAEGCHGTTPLLALTAENEELRKDAERYRCLRRQNWNDGLIACVVRPKGAVKLGRDCPSLDRLDAAIDEIIQENT